MTSSSQPRHNVEIPDRDTFYRLLTASNARIVDPAEQDALREAAVLVAGCDALGASAAQSLIRTGIEQLTLVDDRVATIQRLPRLAGGMRTLGCNCAEIVGELASDLNPFAEVALHTDPLAAGDALALAENADVIVDALGFETPGDFSVRLVLHEAASRRGVPVVSGFDIGGSAWALVYDYRDEQQQVLDGAFSEADLEGATATTPVRILLRLVSLSKAPAALIREAERILLGQRDDLPRSAAATSLAGAIACHAAVDLLLERPARRMIAADIEEAVQPPGGLRRAGQRLVALYSLRRQLRQREREGRVGVFSPLDDEIFQDLRAYMEERAYEVGSVIVRQGDPADEFFVIVEGRVQVEYEERDDDGAIEYTVIAELGPGDYFGEMALLSDTPRAASVVVAERCRVLVLSRGAFEIYLEESGAAAAKVRGEALARLRENRATIGC